MIIEITIAIFVPIVMPNRARLILQYLKLVTFLAVWIALVSMPPP
jgi:hypothetical protein